MSRWMHVVWLVACGVAAGCSEKPLPQQLVWEPVTLKFKASLRGVVTLSPDDAFAVGYRVPEFLLLSQALCLQRSGGIWVDVPVPGHRDVSFQFHDVTRSDDGALWACGVLTAIPDEPSTARPVIYRYDGEWTEVGLDSLANQDGVGLRGIATSGSGSKLEIRAVGLRIDQTGVALQYRDGRWNWMPLPPPGPGLPVWDLACVGRSLGGAWYAAGARGDGAGGAVYVDRGSGWQALVGPPVDGLHFTDLAIDPTDDTPWFTANATLGDSLEGALYALRSGSFVPTPIARTTGGGFRLFAIHFDAQGHGWLGGGRAPDNPFLAGNLTGSWVETVSEAELEEFPGAIEEEGGEVLSIGVAARDRAFAVGQAEEVEAEGATEFIPRILELTPKPIGEIDKPSGPLRP